MTHAEDSRLEIDKLYKEMMSIPWDGRERDAFLDRLTLAQRGALLDRIDARLYEILPQVQAALEQLSVEQMDVDGEAYSEVWFDQIVSAALPPDLEGTKMAVHQAMEPPIPRKQIVIRLTPSLAAEVTHQQKFEASIYLGGVFGISTDSIFWGEELEEVEE